VKRALVILFAGLLGARAEADPTLLRMATTAPDGTEWARVLRAFGHDIEEGSAGSLKMKTYFGGLAGDEIEVGERMQRGQLEGSMSGHMLCERVAPSMRVLRLPGVFQSRGEATDVMNRLQPVLEQEAASHGMVLIGTSPLGADVIFSSKPVKSLAELRKLRLWRWDLDEVGIATSRAMKLQVVPVSPHTASRAFDQGQLDGFLAIPAAALAFQWSRQAPYVTDLRSSYLYGCVMFSQRAFQALTVDQQTLIRTALAHLRVRLDDVGRRMDEQLLGGALEKQGGKTVAVSETFRSEYFATARLARDAVVDKLVPRELVDRVLRMLADYRAEHGR
jgi:TRAP-type C4-dicarboxylate transport system substrate-binding protein